MRTPYPRERARAGKVRNFTRSSAAPLPPTPVREPEGKASVKERRDARSAMQAMQEKMREKETRFSLKVD